MWRTLGGTRQKTFSEAKAICPKEHQKTNMSVAKTCTMAEELEAEKKDKHIELQRFRGQNLVKPLVKPL